MSAGGSHKLLLLSSTMVKENEEIDANVTSPFPSDTCERLQAENQDIAAKLASITRERDEQADENKNLAYDNKLFRDELLKVKEDIAKYKLQLEQNEKEACLLFSFRLFPLFILLIFTFPSPPPL